MGVKRISAFSLAAMALALPASASVPARAPVADEIPVGMLVDVTTGQTLFARETRRRFVPASVTKVMTAYTAFKLVDEGELRLDMPYLYSAEMEEEWYAEGSNMFLRAGERPTIAQLLLGVTTVSGNDASVAIAVAATGSLDNWLDLMNANARELGMHNTHFGSANGFPDGGRTYTTAGDLAILGAAITERYPALYRSFFGHRTLRWRDITQANHDPVTGRVRGADGIKTGFTNEAGFTFLGSAERDSRRLVMVLAGAPTSALRDETARELLEWGFEGFDRHLLAEAGSIVGAADVQDGANSQVNLVLPRDLEIALPAGHDDVSWEVEVVYRGPVQAPIAANQEIARLRVTVGGDEALIVPLQAQNAVEKANAFQRVLNAFKSWLA